MLSWYVHSSVKYQRKQMVIFYSGDMKSFTCAYIGPRALDAAAAMQHAL